MWFLADRLIAQDTWHDDEPPAASAWVKAWRGRATPT
jgi:hypothetical protein